MAVKNYLINGITLKIKAISPALGKVEYRYLMQLAAAAALLFLTIHSISLYKGYFLKHQLWHF